jgi:signal peptidase II
MQPIADRGERRSSRQAAEGTEPAPAPAAAAAGLSPRSRPWLLATAVLVGVVGLDQIAKQAVEGSIVPGEERKLLPGVQLVNTRNHGVAFGFLPGSHVGVTILIGIALLILLVYFARHASLRLIWLPTGMLMGGALGNIIDRLRAGSVTDFIKLPLGWPPFNLADASITFGILILFMVIESSRRTRP